MKKIKYNDEDIIDHHGVVAVIKNKKEEILMQKHLKYEFWTLPVGKVKHNQTIEEGLKQEILEECNLIIKESKEIARRVYNYIRNNKKVKVDVHLFEIQKYSGEMKNNEPEKHELQ